MRSALDLVSPLQYLYITNQLDLILTVGPIQYLYKERTFTVNASEYTLVI